MLATAPDLPNSLVRLLPDQIREALSQYRVVMVWDNFESAEQNLPPGDRNRLGQLLEAIRGNAQFRPPVSVEDRDVLIKRAAGGEAGAPK